MAHRVFHLRNHHEGNAYAIPTTIQTTDGAPKNLVGAIADYYVKEDRSDSDEFAIVHKSGEEGVDEDDIEFTAPGDGELIVFVDTDDTAGEIEWTDLPEGERESFDFWHRLDITDQDGNRVTVFSGDLEVINS